MIRLVIRRCPSLRFFQSAYHMRWKFPDLESSDGNLGAGMVKRKMIARERGEQIEHKIRFREELRQSKSTHSRLFKQKSD